MLTGICQGCSTPRYIAAPEGTVPKRNQLVEDVFGGYITAETKDSVEVSGELIGMRNDSIFVLSDSLQVIPRELVSRARVIVHMPNNYRGAGGVLIVMGSLVAVQAGGFGGAPVGLAAATGLLNGIGVASAVGTEEMKINYFDWSEGWEKVIVYSRFPDGIPPTIKLSELRARPIKLK